MKNMKYIMCCSLAGLLLCTQSEAEEDKLQPATFRIGLGSSFGSDSLMVADDDWLFLPISFSNFYIPIMISDNFYDRARNWLLSIQPKCRRL